MENKRINLIKKNIFIYTLFFFLILNFSNIYGGVIVYQCTRSDDPYEKGEELVIKESATARKKKGMVEDIISEINKTKCIPKNFRDIFNDRYNSEIEHIEIQLICDKNYEDCGEWEPIIDIIKIPRNFRDHFEICGCEEATIFHEMMHGYALIPDTDWGHKIIYGCEIKCLKNLKNCKKYPPDRGDECDCPTK